MGFQDAIQIIRKVLESTGTVIDESRYDGIIVKKLEASNTLDEGRTTNQTHIAITGNQMDIFPYLRSDGYFVNDDADLKKYFITQVPVCLYKSNVDYLLNNNIQEIAFAKGRKLSSTSVVRSKRKNQADQIQLSLISNDGTDFVAFRRLLHAGDYLILLKEREAFKYDSFGVKDQDGVNLQNCNNQFYKLPTNTIVDVSEITTYGTNLRQEFEKYIINVLQLKSTRQVRDLGNLSSMLVEAGVLKKDVYSVSDVEEYRDIVKIIKESEEYKADKASKKEKSPYSGLAYDQGLTNYERFLLSLAQNEQMPNFVFKSGLNLPWSRNRIIFGAPGTGKSFLLNKERKELLGADNETDYERVTFHPDYSYANFVGTYKPVMVSNRKPVEDKDTDFVISILNDKGKTAQEKYDVLYERFKDDGLTRLPMLLGLYTDEMFKTRRQDGTEAAGDNSVERNHGKAIRKYVSLLTGLEGSSDIAYEYVPGPFMRVYVNALKSARSANPKPYLLIIEEINRANIAAVFGDVFQLLDRNEDGVSEYPIQASEDMKKYLAKELECDVSEVEKIRIPDNMFIWATMNSADQGVFPMDTAFKRRWDFTYIGIDDNDEDIKDKYVYIGEKPYRQKVYWNKLRMAINRFLADHKINEDKQLGPYFLSRKIVVPESGNEIDSTKFRDAFKNKVIMYLFEDAARQKRETLFGGVSSLSNRYSKICEQFDKVGIGIFNNEIVTGTEPEDAETVSEGENTAKETE